MWPTRAVAIASIALCASCGASSGTLVNAAINTSIAASVSAARRASGKCYTWCDETSRCDEETGYCVPLPCYGKCRADERCVRQGVSDMCVLALDGDTATNRSIRPVSNDPNRPTPAPANGPPAKPAQPKPPWLP